MAVLSNPLNLPCGQSLSNRLMKAALSEGLGTLDNAPDERLTQLYSRWGEGGFGLIVTGNVMVDRNHLGEPGNVAVEDDRHLDSLTRWAKVSQDGGALVWMQLNHPGRQANPLATRAHPVAPSPVPVSMPGLPTPRELTDEEIEDIIDRFGEAARVADAAGFNGVQIHGAHGYLVSQFLSPLSNRRTDRWGGDLDGRMLFAVEVVRRIRAAVSPSFGVGIKLNSADFQRGGFTEHESRTVVQRLAVEGIDLFEISGGSYESLAMLGRPDQRSGSTQAREAYFLDYAKSARQAAGDVPVAVTGGFRTRSAMVQAIASGDCDVVGLGRPTAIDPAAAGNVVATRAESVPSRRITLGLPARIARHPKVKVLEGALDLQWHTDQLHRLGAGAEPDPYRSAWRTGAVMIKRNGFDAFRNRRSAVTTPKPANKAVRKFRIQRLIGRYLANPLVHGLSRLGVRTSLATDLETIGRKSGRPRRVPVAAVFDPDGAWLISEHGYRSGWAINVGANPVVRIRQGNRWRTGRAHLVPEDDVIARSRTFSANPVLAALGAATFRALQSDPVSVRLDFTDNPDVTNKKESLR